MASSGYRVTLGEDPTFYPATEEKKAFARVSLAENKWIFDKTHNEYVAGDTVWYRGEFFGKDAEKLAASFQKGDRILVLGRVSEEIVHREDRSFRNTYLRVNTFGPDMAYGDVELKRPNAQVRQDAGQEYAQTADGSVQQAATQEAGVVLEPQSVSADQGMSADQALKVPEAVSNAMQEKYRRDWLEPSASSQVTGYENMSDAQLNSQTAKYTY